MAAPAPPSACWARPSPCWAACRRISRCICFWVWSPRCWDGSSPSTLSRLAFGGFGFAGSPEPDAFVPFIAPDAVTTDDLVVDLRSLEEAPVSPFAGARRLDVEAVTSLATPLPSQRVVLCCRSGQRALMAADRLRERGLANLALVALG